MSINILMPALSPTMTEGKLAKWHVKVGDAVKSGQVVCEIETDKATMEVEAVDEGTVAQILIEEGAEGVAVNTPICLLAAEGENVADAAKSALAAAVAPPPKAEEAPAAAKPAEERGWKMSIEEMTIKTNALKTAGIIVLPPSPALKAGFAKVGDTIAAEWEKSAGADGAALLAAFRK